MLEKGGRSKARQMKVWRSLYRAALLPFRGFSQGRGCVGASAPRLTRTTLPSALPWRSKNWATGRMQDAKKLFGGLIARGADQRVLALLGLAEIATSREELAGGDGLSQPRAQGRAD